MPLFSDFRTDHRIIKHKPYKTSMYIDESTRKDDGIYLINAVNINGKDSAEVRVYVLGPPDICEGPIEISGVHKNGCKVAWRPPKDDGGCIIEHYIVEKLDVLPLSFVPFALKKALTMLTFNPL